MTTLAPALSIYLSCAFSWCQHRKKACDMKPKEHVRESGRGKFCAKLMKSATIDCRIAADDHFR